MNLTGFLVICVLSAAILHIDLSSILLAGLAATLVAAGLLLLAGAREKAYQAGGIAAACAILAVYWNHIAERIRRSLLDAFVGSAGSVLPSPPQAPAGAPLAAPTLDGGLGWLWWIVLFVAVLAVVGKALVHRYGHTGRGTAHQQRPRPRRRAALVEPAKPSRHPQEVERDLDPDLLHDELDVF